MSNALKNRVQKAEDQMAMKIFQSDEGQHPQPIHNDETKAKVQEILTNAAAKVKNMTPYEQQSDEELLASLNKSRLAMNKVCELKVFWGGSVKNVLDVLAARHEVSFSEKDLQDFSSQAWKGELTMDGLAGFIRLCKGRG